MRLPEITHLQFLVLGALIDSDQPGHKIRDVLAQHRNRKSAPAFYQMMARLEEAGFVSGRYVKREIDGQIVQERTYKLLAKGLRALETTRDFYLGTANARLIGGLVNAH